MKKLLIIFALALYGLYAIAQEDLRSPVDFFGFEPGADRMLFNYGELIDYLKILDEASPMLELKEIGKSPEGKKIYIAFISDSANIVNLDRLKEVNRQLAQIPFLTEDGRADLASEGKVFFLATLSMHSTEVGPSQSAPAIAYELLTGEDDRMRNWLKDVVYMMVPCHNPDGMDMIVEHYHKYKDTKYEGSSMPGVYHKYIGHDNNRDFVSLTQEDTRAIAAVYNKEWFPHVMAEKHQMGSTGVRYFVPPPHDPIAENIDAGVWTWIGIFGSNMMKDMTNNGLQGIAQNYLFDDYWPGSTETCIWKGVIGMLTEAASVRLASPIYIEHNELKVWGKGLAEYKKSIRMPEPWPGGWWKLSDIIDYEKQSTYSILKTASSHKKEILSFRNELCRKEFMKGLNEPPYFYILPGDQHDQGELVKLLNLLMEHGVEVYFITEQVKTDEKIFEIGDFIVPLAQPYRAFIKEVMETQEFPLRHYTPDGEIIKPYDITSWSLPLHNGVECIEISEKKGFEEWMHFTVAIEEGFSLKRGMPTESWGMLFNVNNNESFKAAFSAKEKGFAVHRTLEDIRTRINGPVIPGGSFMVSGLRDEEKIADFYGELTVDPVFLDERPDVETEEFEVPSVALVETWLHDMDAGWTRYLFDTYHIPFDLVRPYEIKDTDLDEYDVVVIPGNNKDILMSGKYKSGNQYYMSSYPPEFARGMEKEGLKKLMAYVNDGGKIIAWERSAQLFDGTLKIETEDGKDEEFQLPFSDISSELKGLYCPGSLVKVQLDEDSPITLGMGDRTNAFYRGRPAFETSLPRFDMDRRVVGTFPEGDVFVSGYIENEEKLDDKVALVWLKKGKGQMVLFAFHPQFRASTGATYKLLFNSLLLQPVQN